MLNRLIDRVLDRTVLFSFDRSGFQRHARDFRARDLEVDLVGRVCLVTGANSGIGRAAARALAARGAEVWLLCRDRERGEEAVQAIRTSTANQRVHLAVVDISDLGAVRAFADGFTPARVDVLIQNAGVLPATRQMSREGLELTLATNVVGPFLLTHGGRSARPPALVAHVYAARGPGEAADRAEPRTGLSAACGKGT